MDNNHEVRNMFQILQRCQHLTVKSPTMPAHVSNACLCVAKFSAVETKTKFLTDIAHKRHHILKEFLLQDPWATTSRMGRDGTAKKSIQVAALGHTKMFANWCTNRYFGWVECDLTFTSFPRRTCSGVDAQSANVQVDVQCYCTTVGWMDVLTAT